MASKIRILRSTGATAPSSLEYGELAVTIEQGTAGSQANKAGRLFVGNASGNPVELGGEYTYKLMDHVHGELINSSVAIVDSAGQINGWNVAGILTATRTAFTDTVTTNLNVTGVSTFAGDFGLNGDVTIGDSHTDILTVNSRSGFNTDATFNSATLVVGLSTFSGASDFNGGVNVSGGAGLVVSADGTNVTGVSTFNSAVFFQSAIDVDGGAEFDDIAVSAASTFTGAVDMNGGLDVSGGETVLSSATVSDLTDNRIVLAGTSGALEDSANLTFDGTVLALTGNQTITGTLDVDAQAIFDDITVSAAATITGALDVNGGADISGGETVLSSATVSDLTDNRIVLAGTSGALEDSANLTFDGSVLALTGNQTISGTLDVDAQAIFDDITVSAASTFAGVVDINNNVTISGTLDVDAQAIFDDVTVSAAMTVTGAVDFNGGLNVSGAETILSSATVSDLTDNRVVIVGSSGALEDDANFTFDGSVLDVNGIVDAGTAVRSPVGIVTTLTSTNATITDLNVTTDARVGGALTVTGDLTVEGTFTTIESTTVTVADKNLELGTTASPNDTTADGGGITLKGSSDYSIVWRNDTDSWEFNQHVSPDADDSFDLGRSGQEWRNLFVDGLAELDDVNVSAAATIATVDINGGNIDGTTIGAASTAAGTFTTLTAGTIVTGGRLDAGESTFSSLRVTGVSTVATLFFSTGTNTNGVGFFDANGQLQSTATPSAGIQTSNFILTTNASGVPSWTDTIDGGQF